MAKARRKKVEKRQMSIVDVDTAAMEAADPNAVIDPRPLTPDEQALADAQLEQMLTEIEVEVWNAALKTGEHRKGHLSLNFLPVMRSAGLDMVRDFYEQAGKPTVPPGTSITLNLLVKESFLLVGNEKPQKGQAHVIEEVRADETIFDALNRAFDNVTAQLQFVEAGLDDEKHYKAALFMAWTWPKKVGIA